MISSKSYNVIIDDDDAVTDADAATDDGLTSTKYDVLKYDAPFISTANLYGRITIIITSLITLSLNIM